MKILNQLVAWNSVLSNSPSHGESWPPCSAQGETTSQGGSPASDMCMAFPRSAGPQQPRGETPAMLAPFLSIWEVLSGVDSLPVEKDRASGHGSSLPPPSLCVHATRLSRWAGCRPAAEGGASQRVRLCGHDASWVTGQSYCLEKAPDQVIALHLKSIQWDDMFAPSKSRTRTHTERSELSFELFVLFWCFSIASQVPGKMSLVV